MVSQRSDTYLIKHGCRRSACETDSHAFGADVEGQDLRHVGDGETGPCETGDKVEQEHHSDHSRAGTRVAGLSVDGRTTSPDAERYQHADCGDEEELPSPDPIHQLREPDGDEEGPNLQTAVDERLVVGFGDSDALEDVVEVVRGDAIAAALREEACEDNEQETFSVSRRLYEDAPAVLLVELF